MSRSIAIAQPGSISPEVLVTSNEANIGDQLPGRRQDDIGKFFPGFDAIYDIERSFSELEDLPVVILGETFYNIRLMPLREGLTYWAFVSVTHNDTQHVTLITP